MNRKMRIKVCGMKSTQNREQIEQLPVDLLGYIFYAPSRRFVGEHPEAGLFDSAKPKVGVFVDENAFEVMALAKNFGFEYVQLHGKENPKTCGMLKKQGLKIIKAFSVDETFDFTKTAPFEKVSNFFLFDTKTKLHGGSGQKFDWNLLNRYTGHTPFFLSGGITPEDITEIKKIDHPKLTGVDLNSGFEDEPGRKNSEKLKTFIEALNK